MSRGVVEATLTRINELCLEARYLIPKLSELAGQNEEAPILTNAFENLELCVAVLEKELRESPEGLYIRTSNIRDQETIEMLKSQLRQKDIVLQRTKAKLRKKNDVQFEPGFAKSIDSAGIQKEIQILIYKLEAVDQSLYAAVPKLKVSVMLDHGKEALRQLMHVLECCKLDGDKSKLKKFSEASFAAVHSTRELGLTCEDERERKSLFHATDEYETHADLFIASLRRNGVTDRELLYERNECLRCISLLLDVFPKNWTREKERLVVYETDESEDY